MEFVIIGNPTIDVIEGEKLIGGSVIYSSLTISKLGYGVTIIGNKGRDFNVDLTGIDVRLKDVSKTTKFEIGKGLKILERSDPISKEALPSLKSKIVHCAPVFREIDNELLRFLQRDAGFLSVDVHGFVRVEKEGEILLDNFGRKIKADFVKMSKEESRHVNVEAGIIAITKGRKGAEIIADKTYEIPVFPAKVIDPTGAGDVFCGAFLVRYHETKDVYKSGLFASAAASIVCEGKGTLGIPTRKEIEERIKKIS
jgi:hypothetical protein